MNHIPNPSHATLEAYDLLPKKMQMLLQSQQVLETCPSQSPRSFVEHWAMVANDDGPVSANEWLFSQCN